MRIRTLLIGLFFGLFIGCAERTVELQSDFEIKDDLTRNELMQMEFTKISPVLQEMNPEIRTRIWQVKIQDVIDHWGLQGDELKIAKLLQNDIDAHTFEEIKPDSYSSAVKLYDMLMEKGDESAQIRLFMAYEIPQTLGELKQLIHRSDYEAMRAMCQEDSYMRKLLELPGKFPQPPSRQNF